jgi:alkylation response protein AidB-like acyl-CoA dehydrogenase
MTVSMEPPVTGLGTKAEVTGFRADAADAEPWLGCSLTDTHNEIRDAARRYLGDQYPAERIAELADSGQGDLAGWAELRRQGWLDAELGVVELTVLAEESGRALLPAPWLFTAGLAVPVYRTAGAGLPGPATLAGGDGLHATATTTSAGDGWRVDGYLPGVPGTAGAAEILVVARDGDGRAVFGVLPDAPGVTRTRVAGIDPLREAADIRLTGAPARRLAGPEQAAPLLAEIGDRITVMLAGEAVGVAGRALEVAVGYAKVREQFGRPIGSFQAVAHALAEGYADVELARSLAYGAAFAVAASEPGDPGTRQLLALAVHAGCRAAAGVCEAAIQACGGIGVTWEFPLHWWYRRALWLDAFHAARGDPLEVLAGAVLGEHTSDEDLTCH